MDRNTVKKGRKRAGVGFNEQIFRSLGEISDLLHGDRVFMAGISFYTNFVTQPVRHDV
jgi:hypothetical protein